MPPASSSSDNSSDRPDGSVAHSLAISALDRFEHALSRAYSAHQRWRSSAMAAAGCKNLSTLEIAFLLDLARQAEKLTFGQLCANARVEEPYLAHYALRKLRGHGLVEIGRQGREKTVILTDRGAGLNQRFAELHLKLMGSASAAVLGHAELSRLANMIGMFAGVYNEARRSVEA